MVGVGRYSPLEVDWDVNLTAIPVIFMHYNGVYKKGAESKVGNSFLVA